MPISGDLDDDLDGDHHDDLDGYLDGQVQPRKCD